MEKNVFAFLDELDHSEATKKYYLLDGKFMSL